MEVNSYLLNKTHNNIRAICFQFYIVIDWPNRIQYTSNYYPHMAVVPVTVTVTTWDLDLNRLRAVKDISANKNEIFDG